MVEMVAPSIAEGVVWLFIGGLMIFVLGFFNLVFDIREDNRLDRQIRREELRKKEEKERKDGEKNE